MKKFFLALLIFLVSVFLAYQLAPSPRKYLLRVESVDAPSSLKLRLPFNTPSSWSSFETKNGRFAAQEKDTWFVYGWFGAIASIRTIGGIRYERSGGRHSGIDFSAQEGLPVTAAAEGIVTFVGDFYGKTIRISHYDGYETIYGHLSQVSVTKNQKIKAGEIIGKVGATGTLNPHLHFEVNRRVKNELWAINPRKLLIADWSKIIIPDFPANHFYQGKANDADKQEDFILS